MNIKYRKKETERFFKYIESGTSFYIVGAPSAGKTRFIDHLMGDDFDAMRKGEPLDRNEVKKHYLSNELSAKTWLVRVDLNRLRTENGWDFGFFELLLGTLLVTTYRYESIDEANKIREFIAPRNLEVIESKDSLKAHRFFELVVQRLCQVYDIRICFLFDEFDEIYKTMPKEIFYYLRAIRDANKYRVSYALFLRNLPEKLRDTLDNESFHELISQNMIGLGPFSYEDSIFVIGQLEERNDVGLSQEKRKWLYDFSGGHPGFMKALLKLHKEFPHNFDKMQNVEWCINKYDVQEEARKLWNGLLEDEMKGLQAFLHGKRGEVNRSVGELLVAKGLLKSNLDVFSPLFKVWILKQ